ncbi:MAG: HAD-IB family phosphatase [Deltaproteobacteria bacterium]|nr:HAD-IB family phosphatase [Deltaproteobacteria bacterium]
MQRVSSRHIYTGRVIDLRSDIVRADSGREHVADVVGHPGGVVVVAEDQGELLFVRQYRYAVGAELLELVAGTLEPGEDPELAANRELEEEAGFHAARLTYLGAVHSAPGFCAELLHLYLAADLTPSRRPQDDDEGVTLVRIAPAEALRLAASGRIRDAKTLAGLLLYQEHRRAAARGPGAGTDRPVDVVAFDVDGTLVAHPHGKVVWQILMERFGCDTSVSRERFAAFRAGRITYPQWVDLDVGEWVKRGATRDAMVEAIATHLALSPGAREVVQELKARGYHLAVISGTLDVVLDVLFPGHPFDHLFTNRLVFGADSRIASWQATPYDMDGKEAGLRAVAADAGTTLDRCAFVGDHVNDISALRLAGLPIAYDPKHESVAAAARVVLPAGGLRGLLALLP